MAYLMFQYDRPTDTRNWNNYNRHVQDWIAQLLTMPGAISFMAYRAAHQNSPDTFTLLEFRTMEEARQAAASEPMKQVLDELRAFGAMAKVLLVERSPFTPEPILAEIQDSESRPSHTSLTLSPCASRPHPTADAGQFPLMESACCFQMANGLNPVPIPN